MSERSTGWVVNDPDTGAPVNTRNAIDPEGRAFMKVNHAAFDTPAVAVMEPPAPPKVPRRARAAASQPGTTTELDMDDEAAVLDAISRLAAVSADPVYAAALGEIRAAELTRKAVRPAVITALDGAAA